MLSTFIIALREGLEAALIVGILVAYLVKSGRKAFLAPLWAGVALAILASLGTGAFLTITSTELSPRGEEFFAGTTSFLAVALVTWMVFWMKRTARHLKGHLEGQMSAAILGGPIALAGAAFFAVVREGLETSLFIYANFKTVSSTPTATLGLLLGLAVAVALGYLIYRSSIKVNLGKFFTYTGVALIVVAAGVLSYGIHEYQELGWLPGPDAFVWDVTPWIAKESLLGGVLAGTIGFDTTTSWLQLAAWSLYLGVVLYLYLKPSAQKKLKGPKGNVSDKTAPVVAA